MDIQVSDPTDWSLAMDILTDMIVRYLKSQASPQVRTAVLAHMEREEEARLEWEMTAELLGTTDFRLVS
ncbi:hypothetical protein [Paenibacillus camerounensis]|uniref:hypothetical protein n=1 Tax=Paenibacillus camerounensis TaxID=1243663 RepID=UPI0005A905D1|nr:hypothetical protein [Paenibacillus camerounensis]